MKTSPNIYCQQLPERFFQTCPLCGEKQPAMMKGLAADMENGELFVSRDKGYSFCNCRNIFFTDWKNINQAIYDDTYHQKYQCENAKNLTREEVGKIYQIIKKLGRDPKSMFEIGAIHDFVMDNFNERGVSPEGLDIASHASKYPIAHSCNFEEYQGNKKYDLVWASHIFEHLRDPVAALDKCKELLTPEGLLYVAMPDTFFIDFDHSLVYQWDWIVSEHHILWGMDSFVELAKERGWECLWEERNTDLTKQVSGEWFWKRDFKVLLCAKP